MGFDGTRKTKEFDDFHRDWPNIIVADEETIKAVDEKWKTWDSVNLFLHLHLNLKTRCMVKKRWWNKFKRCYCHNIPHLQLLNFIQNHKRVKINLLYMFIRLFITGM